ncbi:MAG TPA: FAD-dependent oxidoreductase [Longimicrobium sp.]|jgi:glycine/D-amino acid oxidase-like deaminating enzyme/nitrite reductase/ring-hydroxylating ferredoxin subunit
MKSSERSVSVWEATREQQEFPRLEGDASVDVCVVGAGIAGISVAYLLAKAGRSVIVLDDNAVGGGETGQTTAHLTSAMDDYYHVLEKVHGKDGARIARESHQGAIDAIERFAREEGIDCDFERVDGYWIPDPKKARGWLEKERDAAHRAGATDVEVVESVPGISGYSGPGLRFPRMGQFHVLKYLDGLVRCIQRDGGRIHTGNHVDKVEGGERPRVSGEGFSVSAGAVVVATNTPVSDFVAIHTKQAPYRTFVVAGRIPAGSVPHVLLWDTLDPYHYIRTQRIDGDPGHEWLIVGGEDHKTGHHDDADERYARLEAWTKEHFPMVEAFDLRWSGQVLEPVDYLGFIGRDPAGLENVYVATGDSGQGMTHGTIAGLLISDLVLGRPNEWESLYDPKRKTLSVESVKMWLEENVDVGFQYKDLLPTGGDVKSADEIPSGSGAILQKGLTKVAAYRDEHGVLHQRVANCTHLGCIVQWNSEEMSWDCPCHGSRFSPTGDQVLNGPAISPLRPYEEKAG